MFFNRRKSELAFCYAFHFLEERSVAKEMVQKVITHFSSRYNIELKSFYSFDYKYRDYKGPVNKIFQVADQKKWGELEQITLSTTENLDEERSLLVDYYPTSRPQLVVSISQAHPFVMTDFAGLLSATHSTLYAYKYKCTHFRACPSYAGGGIENRKLITDLPGSRLKEKVIFRWRENMEAIKDGLLRDIYSENILTSSQMNNGLGDYSLIEAIQKNGLGHVEQMDNGLYYWKIDDEILDRVRKHLYQYEIFV